jgi:serine protease
MSHARSLFVFLLVLLPLSTASAQRPNALPNAVNVLLRPEAARALRPIFASLRSFESNIQSITAESPDLNSLLQLPAGLHGISIKPFLPEHSVVFEDIREHLNPSLFVTPQGISKPSEENALLISSEDRLSRWFIVYYEDALAPEGAAKLIAKSPSVEVAEPIYAAHPCFWLTDSLVNQQYALPMINAFSAWDKVQCDSTMMLADVDLGVQLDHPDLVNAFWQNPGEVGLDAQNRDKRTNGIDDDSDGFVDDWRGWDFAGSTDRTADNDPTTHVFDHGTHTSGIMAASGNNVRGIAGVAFGAKVIPIKTCGDNDDHIYYGYPGIVYSVDRGARAINCSWAEQYHSIAGQDVVDYVYAKGSIVVAAAGNDGSYSDYFPACFNHVFSIGAVDQNKDAYNYNHNVRVAVAAPGLGILSTIPGSTYGVESGTSMACPEVAGAIGLVLQSAKNGPLQNKFPNMSAALAAEQVRATVQAFRDDPNPGFNGRGIIDLERAVNDTAAHSLRVESIHFVGSNTINPDELRYTQLDLKNFLHPISNASVRVESLDTAIVSVQSTPILIDQLLPDSVLTTDGQNIIIAVRSDVSLGTRAYLRVIVNAPDNNYVDTDCVAIKIGQPYQTLNYNDLAVSIYNNGAVGHSDRETANEGEGLVWRKTPPSIGVANRDLLYSGGLVAAANHEQVVDALGGDAAIQAQSGFIARTPVNLRTFPDPAPFALVSSSFSDSLMGAGVHTGLNVTSTSYEFTAAPDALILTYNFSPVDTMHHFAAGLYMDWDLGEGGFNNYAEFDPTDSIFYIHRANSGYPVVAMKVIAQPIGSTLNYYAINRDSEKTLSADDEWRMLTTRKIRAGYADIATVLGVTGIDFNNANPATLTYGIGFGESLASAKNSMQGAANMIGGLNEVPHGSTTDALTVWPNPTSGVVHLSENASHISVIDALGRVVYQTERSSTVDFSTLPAGIYLLEAGKGAHTILRSVIKE